MPTAEMLPDHRRIVAVSAGLGQPSSTRMLADRLLGATQEALGERGVAADTQVIELRTHAHAVVDAMLTGFPAAELEEVLGQVTGAHGLVLVSPVFTTSYSGLFKSFVDILDKDALTGMPVLLGATGGTARHSLTPEYAMRPLMTYLHAEVVTTSVFAATDDWAAADGDAGAHEDGLPSRIRRAGRELAEKVATSPVRDGGSIFDGVPDFERMLGQLGH